MLKKILSYGAIEGVAKGLNKATFLILPLFVSTLGYGKLGLLVSIETILPLLTLLGLDRAILRFYADKENYPNFDKTVSRILLYTHVVLLTILSICYLLFESKEFFGLSIYPDLFLVLILVYFQGNNLIILNKLRVEGLHQKYFRARLFFQTLKISLVILFAIVLDSYLGYLVGAIIAAAAANIFFNFKANDLNTQTYDKKTLKNLLTYSWPLIFHAISINLLGNADKFVIQHYLSMDAVATYTLAYSYGSMISFAFLGLSVYIEPLVYKQEDKNKREQLLDKYTIMGLTTACVSYLILYIGAEYVLPYFYNIKFQEAYYLVPLIAASYFLMPFYYKSNYTLLVGKKSLSVALISVGNSITSIVLNIFLIHKYGLEAAVMTVVISSALQIIIFLYIANGKKLHFDIFYVFLASVVIFICVLNNQPLLILIFMVVCILVYYKKYSSKHKVSVTQ